MKFHERRRQQFLSETHYRQDLVDIDASIRLFHTTPSKSADSESEGWALSRQNEAQAQFQRLVLRYTAGEPIDHLRAELDKVVSGFEAYGSALWLHAGSADEPVFDFQNIDDYCELMQLVGICFLLHRSDLLPRIARLQDGHDRTGGGSDALFEEFMVHAFGAAERFECDFLHHLRPYENLFYGLTEDTKSKQLKEVGLYLKAWYKSLSGVAWFDSHKPREDGSQAGYFGYWSFEAGAAVLLLGIEDDSPLHQYLYYPKDMVAWAREHSALSDAQETSKQTRLRCKAGQSCPREGFWFTPAQMGSRRLFSMGEVMPDLGGDFGTTIWQWDQDQSPPEH